MLGNGKTSLELAINRKAKILSFAGLWRTNV
jgi:hypothetical protein